MARLLLILACLSAALVFAADALAVAPSIGSPTVSADRHPSAVFSAPSASSVTLYVSRTPDRASDGSFLQAAVERVDFLTLAEIQAGAWTYEDQLDPGTYYLMLRATPGFTPCALPDGTDDPACASGYSNVVSLVVPTPPIRYSATVRAPRRWTNVQLRFKATPLGIAQAYRACFRARSARTVCIHHTLPGYSWNARASDYMSISKHVLPRRATVSWYVGRAKVLTKTFLVQRPA